MTKQNENRTGYKKTKVGWIPEEWEFIPLEDMAKIMHGKPQKDVIDEMGAYPILASGGCIGYANNFLYNKPSVLIGRKGTINKPQYMDTPFWTVDTLFYTKIKSSTHPKWLFFNFQNINWLKYRQIEWR